MKSSSIRSRSSEFIAELRRPSTQQPQSSTYYASRKPCSRQASGSAPSRTRKRLAETAHLARLRTVGQMFSELAHEINQPLASAANYARACVAFDRSQTASAEQISAWLVKTVEQTSRAIAIVRRLGSFVRPDDGGRTTVDVNQIIRDLASSSIATAHVPTADGTSVRWELKLDDATPSVEADRVQIEQVLLNLVRNALEAMQESSSPERVLTLQTTHNKRFVCVAVGDTGPGISPENLRRLFRPYFTTKPSGTGLGLSISRSIIADHNGHLTVESSARGTTFRFTLPKVIRS